MLVLGACVLQSRRRVQSWHFSFRPKERRTHFWGLPGLRQGNKRRKISAFRDCNVIPLPFLTGATRADTATRGAVFLLGWVVFFSSLTSKYRFVPTLSFLLCSFCSWTSLNPILRSLVSYTLNFQLVKRKKKATTLGFRVFLVPSLIGPLFLPLTLVSSLLPLHYWISHSLFTFYSCASFHV